MNLGPYAIAGEIGRGGMGVVFRARSPRGEEVAIKLLARTEPEKLARFDRERRLVAAFQQADGFVPLLDAGLSPHGPWLVMPFVGGGTLRDRIQRGPLGVDEAVALGRKLAAAIARAHERGIVHRDLKPENILFTAEGEPLIADLGLAKHFDRSTPGASQSVSLSVSGSFRGTAGYMAPEQMLDSRSVGPAADVFALGAILYECLAWRPAFEGANLIEVVALVEKGEPAPLRRARREVPAALAAAIERALARDPEQRFADASALHAALDAVKLSPRRRLPVALAVVSLLALAGLAAALLLRGRPSVSPPPPPPPAASELDVLLAKGDQQLRIDDRDGALATFEKAVALEPKSALSWAKRARAKGKKEDWDGAIADATRAIELDPKNALGWASRGWAKSNKDDYKAALADDDEAIALDPRLAPAFANRGSVKANTGDAKGALADAEQAIALDPKDPTAWAVRAGARALQGDFKAALADDSRSLELDPKSADTWAHRGWVKASARDFAGAIEDTTNALELEPRNVFALTTRAWAKASKQDFEGAIADDTKAIEVAPRSAQAWSNRGFAKLGARDAEGAIADYEKALELSPDDPQIQQQLGLAKLLRGKK